MSDITRQFERALHPRLPPLLRSLPPMEALTLFKRQETKEEREAREVLRVIAPDDPLRPDETTTTVPAPQLSTATQQARQPDTFGVVIHPVNGASFSATSGTVVDLTGGQASAAPDVTVTVQTNVQMGITSFAPAPTSAPVIPSADFLTGNPVGTPSASSDEGPSGRPLEAPAWAMDPTPKVNAEGSSLQNASSSFTSQREVEEVDMDDSDDGDEDEEGKIPSINMGSDSEEE